MHAHKLAIATQFLTYNSIIATELKDVTTCKKQHSKFTKIS